MPERITGVVLAGGLARRMGGVDKGLVPIAGRPMIAHVIRRLEPQVGAVLVNANRNREEYAALGHPVVADGDGEFRGPLAGMLAAMRAARTPWILTVPCDAPLLPRNLAERLWQARAAADADVAVAREGDRLQPVFALLKTNLADALETFLEDGGRKIDRWYDSVRVVTVDFAETPEGFVNVNDPGQRSEIEAILASRG